jgi:thiol-disulfide isomerase/thioredoxin
MKRAFVLILALSALLLLVACSAEQEAMSADLQPTATAMMDSADQMASDEMASDEMASEEMIAGDESSMEHTDRAMAGEMTGQSEDMAAAADEMATSGDLPAWQTLPLTNARTGETFTLADFAGKTVFVEPMATWCTNCRRQLGNVKDARAELAGDDVVFIALSVETTIDDAKLASYADEASFDWLFAVLSPEMLQQLAGVFGQTIANPPATPHFVLRPDGTVFSFRTGIESTDQIIRQIQLAQA